jgi:hypothetical protein
MMVSVGVGGLFESKIHIEYGLKYGLKVRCGSHHE